jgi:hypothetical protein
MSTQSQFTTCTIQVIQRDGGTITLDGNQVLNVTVSKNIRTKSETAILTLPPNTPNSVTPTDWVEIFTPMSLVIIGMSRGPVAQTVFVGVVTDFEQEIRVMTASTINRYQRAVCVGLKFFFDNPNYYALLAASVLNLLGTTNVPTALQPMAQMLSLSDIQSYSPPQIAVFYYGAPFKGGIGVGISNINTPDNSVISVPQAISVYAWDNTQFVIPSAMFLNIQSQSWTSGFSQMLEWPMYEWYVMTLPSSPYPGFPGQNENLPALGFAPSPDYEAGYPTFIIRPNPFPNLSDPDTADTSLWNTLPVFTPSYGKFGYISVEVGFSIGEDTTNVFFVNPIAAQTALPNLNEDFTSIIYALSMGYCQAAIQKYGYRPFVWSTNYFWLGNPRNTGSSNENAQFDPNEAIIRLILRAASWGLSTPYCAHGGVTFDLRPDIYPGTKIQFAPFRDGNIWEFYITGVEHVFSINGSQTTLQIERGLPVSVYSDLATLATILNGSADKVDGQFITGGQGLQINALSSFDPIQSLVQLFTQNFENPKQ